MNIVKKIKHIIRWITPFGIVRRYYIKQMPEAPKEKQSPAVDFMSAFKTYLDGNDTVTLMAKSPYKTIVSVQGFGFSGSGAVLDLLREYQSTQVLGFVDVESSLMTSNNECEEIDMLRLSGGLFEVEKYLDSNNIFQNDALLHRLIALIEQSSVYKCYPQSHAYFFEYLRQICQIHVTKSSTQFYNPHLDYKGKNDILFLKVMSLSEYREISRQLLYSIFHIIQKDSKADCLVLDQLVSDMEFNYAMYKQYVPNLKSIIVYRDPRDIFIYAKLSHENWIPNEDVNEYINWYKVITMKFNSFEHVLYQVVRFEDLLLQYDKEVKIIENYIGLTEADHIEKKRYFDPAISRKNMSIYLQYPKYNEDCMLIKEALSTLCFD